MSDSVYLLPTGIYLLVYFFGYLIPLLRRLSFTNFKDDLSTLKHRMRKEVNQEETSILHGDDTENNESDRETRKTNVERLRARTLDTSFKNPFVKQAAEQLRVRYPQGNYRNFEIERLPIYATYAERLTAARNMAGLFVLTGLLGTMMELEGLVTNIGGAASKGEMGEDSFLATMGSLMGDMGGAFTSSIIGLAIMLIVLVVIGLLDRIFIQTKLDRLDSTVQSDVVNQLAQLQRIHAPDTSMSDLIDQTGDLLTNFSQAVDDLSDRMVDSLSGLSDEIEEIMQEFRTFRQQHENLNQLISRLREHAGALNEVTDSIKDTGQELRRAGETLADPINKMNRDLNNAIREQMGMVGEAVTASAEDRDALIQSFQALEQDLKRQTQQLRDIARDSLQQIEAQRQQMDRIMSQQQKQLRDLADDNFEQIKQQQEQMDQVMDHQYEQLSGSVEEQRQQLSASIEHQREQLAQALEAQREENQDILKNEIRLLAEHSDAIQEELRAVSDALAQANNQELAAVIGTLRERMNAGSDSLSSSAEHLSSSASKIDQSADRLEHASRRLANKSERPASSAEWLVRKLEKMRNGSE